MTFKVRSVFSLMLINQIKMALRANLGMNYWSDLARGQEIEIKQSKRLGTCALSALQGNKGFPLSS